VIERRQPNSPRHAIDRGHAQWLELMFLHRGKVWAFACLLGSVVTFLATMGAMRYIALDRLARVEQADVVQDSAISSLRRQVTSTERDVATNRFLLCVMAARIDPKRSEATCEPILGQGAP
jgi:uncharacterized coiled-coil protein SlyX